VSAAAGGCAAAPRAAGAAADADTRLNTTFAIVNDAGAPAPYWVPNSLHAALLAAGAGPEPWLEADVMLLCKAVPSARPIVPGSDFVRATSIRPGDVSYPERWEGGRGAGVPVWAALVEVDVLVPVGEAAGPSPGPPAALHRINVRVASDSLDRGRMDHDELRALWRVLEAWAVSAFRGESP
jgi:hypothetical protein